ncbi:methyltransferase domain-containing protein [Paracidovorax valerianellae]|uniref:Glycosyltransferase, GT2 family n=1 Tax=Paracidovorax valerianellae TaxID=187868 RepID=A0A1G7BIS4_9BURK|nr:methyltransferase domain-containing protein [Paracidovorax valerianellae]MDA8445927.1 methyltransferase domain-containing protein [Paracidovorax valerianellae]SDE26822.1 Glycosyltransferase, GT2 family [Paracidovorax valerianellae]
MTQTIEDLHVYLRTIKQDERTSLSVLASLVREGTTVLDLGCGSGALGQYLAETRSCTSDGVTLSEAEAEHARPHYRRVEVADLEACDLVTLFTGQRYDYIVCADVLEHLRRPEGILAQCRELLAPGGQLLISVPNAGYCGLIAELLQGEFRYREEGLLDRTHLRFFTRRSLARFLGEQRWAVDQIDTVRREVPESEFKAAFDLLPPAVARHLLIAPDAMAYQFIAAAQPAAQAITTDQGGSADADEAHALFTAQLYLGQAGHYAEDRKLTSTGIIGRDRQTVRFALPDTETPLTNVRLDPADRPGFMHLHGIALRNADGEAVWTWQADSASRSLLAKAPHSQIVWEQPMPAASPATLLLLTGDDPWMELPIPREILTAHGGEGATLDIELGWPMSADYLALSNAVFPLQDRISTLEKDAAQAQRDAEQRLRETREALEREKQSLGDQKDALEGDKRTLEYHNQALQEHNQTLKSSTETLLRQRADLQLESAQFQRNATRLQHELGRLQHDYGALAHHLKTIENSTVFRATRPLVHTKMRLDRLLGRAPKHAAATAQGPVQVTPPSHPVDVIVPVYRGLADTQMCVDSVLASPCATAYRLIVINDASPEPEVTAWLRERATQDDRIVLLENEENLGFVGTVNRGMALSGTNDVLLLNSDTEVANDWLDRIRQAAYGDAKVASVTPFSNNATICSYPRFCKDNDLPPGYDTARLDALCAKTNAGAVVDVPTGVGFCMYIRRDCLVQLGLFDTEHFGKGYGEENDFCQRAHAAGWRNLHLLDTFVLHTGGVSFGDSKSPRELAAMETLRRLHPRYERDVHAFVQADPAQPYRLALDVARIAEAGVPAVLAVLHDRAGGTVRHVRELASYLADQATFLTLTPAPGHSVRLRMASEDEGFELTFRLNDQYDDLLGILRQLGVRHVHFHHLLGHGQEVRNIPHLLDVPYDFTAHDYYSYCTHISMTDATNRYAGEIGPGQCKCCAPEMHSPMGGTVAEWRGANARLLTGARRVLAPSHDTARRIAGFAPAAHVHAVPHTDLPDSASLPVPAPRTLLPGQRLKVVVIGALSAIKGADVLEAVAIEAARRNALVDFHLIGYGYRHLQTQPRARLTIHGEYEEKDLPGLLQWLEPDLVWFPAQWPETYSYTLSAALLAGLPVVVPDIGAFGERLSGRPWSWVHPWDATPAQWLAWFTDVRDRQFAKGEAPDLEESQPTPPVLHASTAAPFRYESDYLENIALPAPVQPIAMADLQQYLPQATPTAAAKSGVLSAVVYLRSLPVLRGVAQRIPSHWQRRVKNWLQA